MNALLPYVAPALLLLLSGLAHVFARAYRFSSEAGVDRLAEKFPAAKERLEGVTLPAWNRLRAAMDIVDTSSRFGALFLLWQALSQSAPPPLIQGAIVAGFALAWVVLHHLFPRALAEGFADRICIATLGPVRLLALLLSPLASPLAALETRFHRRLQEESDDSDRPTAEEEILSLVEGDDNEDLEDSEREMIRSVFEFGETLAREIMTPRVNILGLEDTLTVGEAIDEVKDSIHSRFPVFHESLDDVRGIVHIRDLLRLSAPAHRDQPIDESMLKVSYVPESMPIDDLLKKLRTEQHQSCIVVDEYGGTAGLVTMEDIIEELVGEIEDEYDTAESNFVKLTDGSWVVDAKTPVVDINQRLNLTLLEREDYDSLGGYLFHRLGRIPAKGERVEGPDHEIVVRSATDRQIGKLRIIPRSEGDAEDAG